MSDKKVIRDLWRVTLGQLVTNPGAGWSNLRFCVGLWVGGFTSATRNPKSGRQPE